MLAAILPLISIGLWALAAIVGQRFGHRSLAPLSQMAEADRAMPWTDGDARLPSPGTRDELEDFAGSFNLNATIHVESEPGQGSYFMLQLPEAGDSTTPHAQVATQPEAMAITKG